MGLEAFNGARDLAYISAVFLGISLAALLRVFISRIKHYRREFWWVTASLALSVSIVFVTIAILLAKGFNFFNELNIIIPFLSIALAGFLSLLFPRSIGFPLFIVMGLVISMGSYFFLRLPIIGPTPILVAEGVFRNKEVEITLPPRYPYDIPMLFLEKDTDYLVYVSIQFAGSLPLVGGKELGAFVGTNKDFFQWYLIHPFIKSGGSTLPCISVKEEKISFPETLPNAAMKFHLLYDDGLRLDY